MTGSDVVRGHYIRGTLLPPFDVAEHKMLDYARKLFLSSGVLTEADAEGAKSVF